MPRIRRGGLVATAVLVALLGAACSGDDDTDAGTQTSQAPAEAPMDDPAEDMSADELVGAGCADYAAAVPSGAGSVEGMAQDPVATAASNNPLLGTLVQAVSGQLNPEVDLVDTLNGDEFTVFAPVDDAFSKIPAETIEALQTDADLLTTILTYHVVPGKLSPDEVVGMQTSVQGEAVDVTGSGEELMANDAGVICGGVRTANATVYLIDTVLMPPSTS
ncbi:MAG: fasciclin domain-containing protein [Acidimicrobiales bacterium]